MKRKDDFDKRREPIAKLNDKELYERFWQITEKVVQPMVDLGKKNTTPSIERSVLLRMGISSLDAKSIVDKTIDAGLMGKGSGHMVYRLSKEENISIKEAGDNLARGQGWDKLIKIFKEGN